MQVLQAFKLLCYGKLTCFFFKSTKSNWGSVCVVVS